MKLGVLGGTFDPIHLGHLMIAEEVRVHMALEQVLFVPTGLPWLKAERIISPTHHRMEMVKLATASNPFFKVSDVEVTRPGPSYTLDTLTFLRGKLGPSAEVFFILGLDSLMELQRWHQPAQVLAMCTLVAVTRPGFLDFDPTSLEMIAPGASKRVTLIEGPLVSISGSEIRRRVARGISIRYWVPAEVEEYIYKHGLYKEVAADE